jgi:EAL domain-containing protein (putative c-di-GMP-specific phosphodiesterase class I)
MVSLCDGLELNMVAEGIETEAHRQLLVDIGCEVAQGFLFHEPMKFDDVDRVLQDHADKLEE